VTLDRLDMSPLQVAAADEMLRTDPLGGELLSAAVDPAAALGLRRVRETSV
jgi:hypothetical protein